MRRLSAVTVVAFGLALVACSDDESGGAPRQGEPAARQAPAGRRPVAAPTPFPGKTNYEAAKQAVFRNDMETAIARLEEAVNENADFTEAWYQLGAARSNLAIDTVLADETAAVMLFHDAVAAKRQAQALMDQGIFWVWDAQAQAEARSDLELALEDADEVTANEESLVIALRLYAAARQ